MKILILLTILPTIFGEAPYPASGWRPQGQPFNLPSRPQQQYGAPQNQQSLNNQYSLPQNLQNPQNQLNQGYSAPQISNQYGAPQQNGRYPQSNQLWGPQNQQGLNNQYGAPQNQQVPQNQYGAPQQNRGYPQRNQLGGTQIQQSLNYQYNAPQNQFGVQQNAGYSLGGRQNLEGLNNHYVPPQNQQASPQNQINNQYGVPENSGYPQPQNNYTPPSVDPLRTQNLPDQQSNSNFNPQNTAPPGRTYLSQTPNPLNTPQTTPNQQLGQLRQQESSQNQDIEFLGQNTRLRETVESVESNQDQQDNQEDVNQERGYVPPTTNRRKQPRRNERTTERPTTTTENPDNDGENSDQPNVAISTAVASGSTTGQYYILQPDGKLQRVVYMTSIDPNDKNEAVLANLMYELVEPLKGPIYQYVGNELVRIN